MLAWCFYGDGVTAVLSAAITASLPLTIQFSSTAFLDPFMTFWLAAALAALVHNKPAWSGFFFGLAVFTKYQAWLFLPLLLAIGWLWGWRRLLWLRWLAGGLPIGLLLAAWGWARAGGSSLWSAQMANFGGVRLSWSWELWPRGLDWLQVASLAVGSAWLGVIMFLLILVAGIRAKGNQDGNAPLTHLLILFIAGYLILHWLLAIPVWDRYLLPLMPLVAVLAAHQLALFSRQISIRGVRLAAAGILSVLLLLGAWGARHGRYPIGGQPGADQGASVVAAALADAPYGTVLYDHWFSWQWRYHLFDKKVHVSWFPYPEALATELAVFGDNGQPHYLALPDSDQALPVRRAVTAAGFRLQPVALSVPASIQLYEITR
jgi:4-amino-4-deoxy-L-arabinose transferase-like glycosyltransferase